MGSVSKPRRAVAGVAVAFAVVGGVTLPASPAAATVASGVTTMDKSTLRFICSINGGSYLEYADGGYSCLLKDAWINCDDGRCIVYSMSIRPPEGRPQDYSVDPDTGVVLP